MRRAWSRRRAGTRLVWIVTKATSVDVLLRGQLRYFRERGFDVSVIAEPGPELDRVAAREGVAVHGMKIPPVGAEAEFRGGVRDIARKLRRLRAEVVCAGTLPAAQVGLVAARLARVPCRIYSIRGLPLETATGPARAAIRLAERRAILCAHEVFAVSASLRRRYRELGLDARGKSRVVGHGSSNGVDEARFSPAAAGEAEDARRRLSIPTGAIVLGWVGRPVKNKGIDDLVRAFARVREADPNVHLLWVGAPPSSSALDPELCDRLARDPQVRITGHVEDTSAYYRAMDLFVFPSYREGLPNVALEASANGLAIAAYAATGTLDAVDQGRTGTLVPVGDVDGLTDAMLRYVGSYDLRSAHGRAGRERVLRLFRREDVWESLRVAVREAIERRRSRIALDEVERARTGGSLRSGDARGHGGERLVWITWFQGETAAPPLVKTCIESWRRHNPTWDVRVLDQNTLKDVRAFENIPPAARRLPHAALSDVVRVNLLATQGGVWTDASCLCRAALDSWLPDVTRPAGFFGFDRPSPDRLIASWFLASEADHVLVRRWCGLVNDFWNDNPTARVQSLEETAAALDAANPAEPAPLLDVGRWVRVGEVPYFWFHYLFAHLMETDEEARLAWSRVPKLSADPPHLFCNHGFDRPVDDALIAEWNTRPAPLYKLTWRTDAPPESAVAFAVDERNW